MVSLKERTDSWRSRKFFANQEGLLTLWEVIRFSGVFGRIGRVDRSHAGVLW